MEHNRGNLRGYALLKIEAGQEREFFSGLYDIPEVGDVHFIVDGCEYMISVNGTGPEDVARIMTERIRTLPGVARMATFIEGRHLPFAR